jgi:succinate dehydrogenase/fumarate reductase flavoprotein subunit
MLSEGGILGDCSRDMKEKTSGGAEEISGVTVWPYPIEWDRTEEIDTDVLVIGGGASGCFAAMGARSRGARVVMMEKAATLTSGAMGSGCDHWEMAATNPCSRVTPEDLTDAMIRGHRGYNNGISHYIESRESYDRLLELERYGGKIRDTEDEFKGAPFRDDSTKFMFAYDYHNRFTLRVWGATFKAAMYRGSKQMKVQILDRTMGAGLLTENGKVGSRVVGAVAINGRSGKFIVCRAKATVFCMSRPTRLWLFAPGATGISEFRPPQCTGDGHAMAWRVGGSFTMLEKSLKAEWSGLRSYPPYSAGNNHNSWYACTMVDAEGRAIPWVDRDGRELKTVEERYYPSPGQKFFMKGGGEPDFPFYEFEGPETISVTEALKRGYKLPFYADLTSMPEVERRVIWGMMIGNEGKTRTPVLKAHTDAGFDPKRDLLQSYGDGWRSGQFLPQERQFFGIPGGMVNDWKLMTNLEGLFAAGDVLFASDCVGHAAATGHYAGRHAADYAAKQGTVTVDKAQVEAERARLYEPLKRRNGIGWQALNTAITRIMQNYCGAVKSDDLLNEGLKALQDLKENEAAALYARNPHDLLRAQEVLNILTNAELVMHSCMARKASSQQLQFQRLDYPAMDPPEWHKFITVWRDEAGVRTGELPIDYYGDLTENYERHNPDYISSTSKEKRG